MRRRIQVAVSWMIALAWVFLAAPLQAENLGPGGGTRILLGDEPVGPYRVLATVAPEPAQVGPVTFVVRISDLATGATVRDAQVWVELRHTGSTAALAAQATHGDAGNPVDYAAHIEIAQAGVWEGVLRIVGPAGSAQATFTQRVTAPRSAATLILVGIPFLVVLAGLAGFWYFRSTSATQRQQRDGR